MSAGMQPLGRSDAEVGLRVFRVEHLRRLGQDCRWQTEPACADAFTFGHFECQNPLPVIHDRCRLDWIARDLIACVV